INANNDIFRFRWDSQHWQQVKRKLTRISLGSRTSVWGVNATGEFYKYTNNDNNPW
ncbi:hypothetical protein BJ165DRAFT_1326052, partial [Panaeolus papilionaceus]